MSQAMIPRLPRLPRLFLPVLPTLLLSLQPPLACARELQPKPSDPFYAKYEGLAAPAPAVKLQAGDKLAICGDSITEQKMYSRIIEAYITACLPELQVTCRQFGWSGEQAGGFLKRMKNDVLRFQPTVATTCYGMNDHRYVPYEEAIGAEYRQNQTAIVKQFKEAGVRVVLGSSGTIHSVPGWVKNAKGTWEDLNLSLLQLRNINIEIATAEQVGFADVYWPMLVGSYEAKQKYGQEFKLEGGDGVHPGWAGQVFMATAFLQGLGVDGNLGEISVDLAKQSATATNGQKIVSMTNGQVKLQSARLPFHTIGGDLKRDDNIKAGQALSGFQEKLNRLTLKAVGGSAANYTVTWGDKSKPFTKEALAQGINLAGEFEGHPLAAAFEKIWNAVGAKQEYETRQIKQLFHGPEGEADAEATAALTEKVHGKLVQKLKASYAPVESVIKIEPAAN
jgi:lysophospholipase L1-like esterase